MKYFGVLVAFGLVGSSVARPDGAGGHHGHHDHGHAAASAVAAPAAAASGGYQEPAYDQSSGYDYAAAPTGGSGGYAAAATGYESSGYETGYDVGNSGYGAVEQDSGFNPSMLIIPILIIAGIALLFPSVQVVPVTANRKKRSAEDEVSGNSLVDRVQDIFMAVMESEECFERIACEMGGLASDAGINKNMMTTAAAFVPKKYTKMMKQFNNPKNCHKIKCGSF